MRDDLLSRPDSEPPSDQLGEGLSQDQADSCAAGRRDAHLRRYLYAESQIARLDGRDATVGGQVVAGERTPDILSAILSAIHAGNTYEIQLQRLTQDPRNEILEIWTPGGGTERVMGFCEGSRFVVFK